MALWGLLGGDKKLSPKKIQKSSKLITNPFAQSDARMREMYKLLRDDSLDAYKAALKRFSANANGHIADEDEKKWLEDQLVEHGDSALEALEWYIRNEEQVTYALRAYERICGRDKTIDLLVEVLGAYGPDAYRATEAKLQMIWHLSDSYADARLLRALLPFWNDHSDEVRWASLDLFDRAFAEKVVPSELVPEIQEQLAEAILDESTSIRIRQRLAELAQKYELQLSVQGEKELPDLDEQFFVDKKGFVRPRVRPGRKSS